jgi:hypothetical protein
MEEDNIEGIFKALEGKFDIAQPAQGHKERFLEKLLLSGNESLNKRKKSWWKPLAIAASIAVIFAVGIGILNTNPTIEEQLAQISPEVSQSQFYFASLIEQQIQELEDKSTPETRTIVDDTMLQLKKLETNYAKLEQDLLNGGNSKLILSAMITNFQTRIDLLQDVMDQIDTINNLNSFEDEMNQNSL